MNLWQKLNARKVETISASVSWLSDVAKQVLVQTVETHSDIEPDAKWKSDSEGNWHPTKWSITKLALGMVALTLIQICVSVVYLLMRLMVVAWGMLKPKAYGRKSDPNEFTQLRISEVPTFRQSDRNYRWMSNDFS